MDSTLDHWIAHKDSTVLTAARTAGAGSVCKVGHQCYGQLTPVKTRYSTVYQYHVTI